MATELPTVSEPERAERCETCKWWKEVGESNTGAGWCHRYPPMLFPYTVRSQAEKALGGNKPRWEVIDMASSFECDSTTAFGWPATEQENFCGEWRAK